ncbi:MAG: glycosyltransferase [Pseudomonadota bacterium]
MLDLERFPAPPKRRAGGPFTILSVCRAVEKKGLDDVLNALAKLPAGLDWRFEHVGGGAMVERLHARAERLGIAARVSFLGAMDRAEVIAAYRRADVFLLASRIAKNGDRDGLPNVIMEAMAMGLPVVSTAVSAVPEIVTAQTGILVEPRDPAALAGALAALAGDPVRRAAMGAAGAERVRASFSPMPGFMRLMERFREGGLSRAA